MPPLMISQLVILPSGFAYLALIAVALPAFQEWRSGHIGRVGIFVNVVMLWQIFYAGWSTFPLPLQVYLNLGTVVAIVAAISYIKLVRLPSIFYSVARILYGSLTVGVIILVAMAAKHLGLV
jgi:hypothetical protein